MKKLPNPFVWMLLLAVSMIGVGYSSWLILQSDAQERTASGQIEVSVDRDEVGIVASVVKEYDGAQERNPINLASNDSATRYSWVAFDMATSGAEDLTFDLEIEIKPDGADSFGAWLEAGTADLTDEIFQIWLSGFDIPGAQITVGDEVQSYVTAPQIGADHRIRVLYDEHAYLWRASVWTRVGEEFVPCTDLPRGWETPVFELRDQNGDGQAEGILTLRLRLGWGSVFDGKNPNEYVNGSAVYDSDFAVKMAGLQSITRFCVTVSAQK